jgi:hypothetical protein
MVRLGWKSGRACRERDNGREGKDKRETIEKD